MNDLFRQEAVFHATRRRLSGSVVLATPLSVRCLGLVLAAIVLAAVIFVSIASYARKATVTGWLVPDQGLIRATASSAGFISSMEVKEGDRIERGAKLAEIQIAADTAAGNVGEQAMTQLRAEAEAARAKAQSQIERLDAESVQARARLGKLRGELQQVQMQAELQEKRLALARQEVARSEELAARGLLALRDRDARRANALAAEQDMAIQRRLISSTERDISDVSARMSAITLEKVTAAAESRAAEASLEQRMNRGGGATGPVRAVAGRRAGRGLAGRRRATGIAGRHGRCRHPRGRPARSRVAGAIERRRIYPSRPGHPPHAAGLSISALRHGQRRDQDHLAHRARSHRDLHPRLEDRRAGVPRPRDAAEREDIARLWRGRSRCSPACCSPPTSCSTGAR